MLINPNTGAPTNGATVGGLRWSPRQGGSVIGAEPVNNFDSASNAFQTMNESIIRLDNQYESLSSTEKSDWEDAMRAMPANVCGCLSVDVTPKKLYRLQNYAREMVGKEDSPAPIIPRDIYYGSDRGWEREASWTWWGNYGANDVDGGIYIIQQGHGNLNYIVKTPPAPRNSKAPDGSPLAAQLEYLSGGQRLVHFLACFFSSEGWPLGQNKLTIYDARKS